MADEWFSPSEIKYWPEHIQWLIEHLRELEQGRWPPNPRDTGYTDMRAPGHSHSAYFEVPVCLSGEVNARLDRCGQDGKLTRRCLADGWDALTLAELMHTQVHLIENRTKRVISYCSGWRRRRLSYNEFKRRAGIRESYRRVKT